MRVTGRAAAVICLVAACHVAAVAAESSLPFKSFKIEEGNYSLNLGIQLQLRGLYRSQDFSFDGPLYDGVEDTAIDWGADFMVRRARIALYGGAFAPWFKYKLEADFGGGRVRATDLYLDLDFNDVNRWRVGQFKQPFDTFQIMSSKGLMFVERSMATSFIQFLAVKAGDSPTSDAIYNFISAENRDIGVMYSGRTKSRRFQWFGMVGNGNGANQSLNDDDTFMLVGRLEFQNEGGFAYNETAIDHPDELQYMVSLAYEYNPKSELVGDAPTGERRREKNGDRYPCEIGTSGNCAYESRQRNYVQLFGALRGRIFQVNGAYYLAQLDDAAADRKGEPASLDLDAWVIEGGVFVTPKWEIAGRYDQVAFKDAVDITFGDGTLISDRNLKEWRLGTNYYFYRNNLKVLFDVGSVTDSFEDNSPEGHGRTEHTVDSLRAMLAFYL